MREYVRRFVCWLFGHHPVGPPFYSPMCARCGLILHDNCTAWGADPEWDAHVEALREDETERLRESLGEAWVQYGYCSAASLSVEDKDAAWKRLGQILALDGLRREA